MVLKVKNYESIGLKPKPLYYYCSVSDEEDNLPVLRKAPSTQLSKSLIVKSF
jgi:hypothetical protein